MATNTPNLNLIKPDGDDPINVQDFNDNSDILDSTIAAIQANSLAVATTSEAQNGVIDNKVMTPLKTSQIIDYKDKYFYGTTSGVNSLTVTLDRLITILYNGTTITFKNTNANTGNVTIAIVVSGVSTTKSVLNNDGTQIAPNNLKAGALYTIVYDGTNFYLVKGGGGSLSGIKSVQRGTVNISNSETTVTQAISSVNVNKSILKIYLAPSTSALNGNQIFVRAVLNSGNQILFSRHTSGSQLTLSYEVIEFVDSVNVYRGSTNLSSSTQSITITTVDASKSFVFATHSTDNTTSAGQMRTYQLTNNSINCYKQGVAGNDSVGWFVVEFP